MSHSRLIIFDPSFILGPRDITPKDHFVNPSTTNVFHFANSHPMGTLWVDVRGSHFVSITPQGQWAQRRSVLLSSVINNFRLMEPNFNKGKKETKVTLTLQT